MFQFYLATMLKKLNSLFSIILMNQNLAGLGMKFCQHISLKQMWVTRCTGGGAQRGSCFPAALLAHAGDTRPSPAAGLVPTSCPPPPWLPLRPRGSRGWGQPSPWCPVLPAGCTSPRTPRGLCRSCPGHRWHVCFCAMPRPSPRTPRFFRKPRCLGCTAHSLFDLQSSLQASELPHEGERSVRDGPRRDWPAP